MKQDGPGKDGSVPAWIRTVIGNPPQIPDKVGSVEVPDYLQYLDRPGAFPDSYSEVTRQIAEGSAAQFREYDESLRQIQAIRAEKEAQKRADHEELVGLSREQVEQLAQYKQAADKHMQIAADHLEVAQEHREVAEKQLGEAEKLHTTATEQLAEAKRLYDVSKEQLDDAKSSGRWGFRGFWIAVVALVFTAIGAIFTVWGFTENRSDDTPAPQPAIEEPAEQPDGAPAQRTE